MLQASLSTFRSKGSQLSLFCLLLFGMLAMGSPPCSAADEEAVKKAFEVFRTDWIVKMNQHGQFGRDKIKVEEDAEGRYCATYRVIAEDMKSEVKATGEKASPYIGVFKYEVHTYASHAESPELAKQGPFEVQRQVAVTEIFRYSGGKWHY
jgi:hypothetical protein